LKRAFWEAQAFFSTSIVFAPRKAIFQFKGALCGKGAFLVKGKGASLN